MAREKCGEISGLLVRPVESESERVRELWPPHETQSIDHHAAAARCRVVGDIELGAELRLFG